MKKKLSAIGNSFGIVIEKPILELLKIERETELEMSTDGDKIIFEVIREPAKKKKDLKASISKIRSRHDSTFRKLAK